MKRFISFSEKFASALLILALILGGMNVPATVWAAEDSGDEVVVIEDDTAATVNADTEAETDAATETAVDGDSAPATDMVIDANGMAQPVFKYKEIEAGYTNADSEILRFAVYVETDHDTDMDGKTDLVQAVVQVPRAACEGKYKAPAIFEASPYLAGTDSIMDADQKKEFLPKPLTGTGFNENELYDTGTRHTATEDPITSLTLAASDSDERFSSKNWYYNYPHLKDKEAYFINSLTNHDYFLIRGFAVVESAGLGTNGSDGLSICGGAAEVDAFKNVVEWIHGNEERHAYADKNGTIPISADWANGKVAMRGCSYNGTMAYEVAATGVEGLMTIVPESGISSWYEYSNTQGVSHYDDNKYTTSLAGGNSSRFFGLDTRADAFRELCSKLFGYFDESQEALAGHYGQFWSNREFSDVGAGTINASALITQGLNDTNVRPKQADLMRKAFERSGCEVRMILHQGGHDTLDTIEMYSDPDHPIPELDNLYFEDILNKWYCHYLCDTDNDIVKKLPKYYVQSNTDGSFHSYNEWYEDSWFDDSSKHLELTAGNTDKVTIAKIRKPDSDPGDEVEKIDPDMRSGDDPDFTIDDFFRVIESNDKGEEGGGKYFETWIKSVPKQITIQGKPEIHLKAGVSDIPENGRMVLGAMLYDVSAQPFDAYFYKGQGGYSIKETIYESFINRGPDISSYNLEEFKKASVNKKLITKGVIDIGSPNIGYEPGTAVQGNISAGSYYDYTIHMEPTVYTLQPGHYLWLYLIPVMDSIYSDVDINIDNAGSFARIPVSAVPDGFNNYKTEYKDGYIYDYDENGTEVSKKYIEDEAHIDYEDSSRIITESSEIRITGLDQEYKYLGVPVKPDITVYDGTDPMTIGTDYTISYGNNTKPTELSGKDATLTITFKGEYASTPKKQLTFKIAKTRMSDTDKESDVYVHDAYAAYTGSALRPVPVIEYTDEEGYTTGKTIAKSNFRFSYLREGATEPASSVTEDGNYTIIIEPSGPKSYCSGKMTANLTVTKTKNTLLSGAKVVFDPGSYTYTGEPIPPTGYTLKLKLDGKEYTDLIPNEDYKLSNCYNNTDPGKAVAVFDALPGNTKGITGSVKATFKITKGRVLQSNGKDGFKYNYQEYVPFAKSGAEPAWLNVYDGKNELKKGTDYTVSFSDNKSLTGGDSKAHMTITGKGKYKGQVTLDYYIVKANISRMNVSIKDKVMPSRLPADGSGYKDPDIVITDAKGKKLIKGQDYKFGDYKLLDANGEETAQDIDQTKTSWIRVTIVAMEGYFGEITADYMYYDKAHDLSKVSIDKKIADKTYNGSDIYPTTDELNALLIDKKNDNTKLKYDKDFFIESYKNNRKSGTATVVLRGKGAYGGTRSVKFKIKRQGKKNILGH